MPFFMPLSTANHNNALLRPIRLLLQKHWTLTAKTEVFQYVDGFVKNAHTSQGHTSLSFAGVDVSNEEGAQSRLPLILIQLRTTFHAHCSSIDRFDISACHPQSEPALKAGIRTSKPIKSFNSTIYAVSSPVYVASKITSFKVSCNFGTLIARNSPLHACIGVLSSSNDMYFVLF